MHIGKKIADRGLFGPNPPKHFEGVYTCYDDDSIPVAALGNFSTRSVLDCNYELVRDDTPSGWGVRTFSCRTTSRNWLFGIAVFKDGVDPAAFDNISIADEVVA